jgi:hypothetical protein
MPFPMEPKENNPYKNIDYAKLEEELLGEVDAGEQLDIIDKILSADKNSNVFKKFKQTLGDFAANAEVEEEEPGVTNHWRQVRNTEMLVYYPRKSTADKGYEDHSESPGWLNFYNVKDLLARFFVTIHAHEGKVTNWRELCIGVTSLHHDGEHLPMFDYDGKNIKTRVKKDIKTLQSKFKLGDATIYETRRGLHVYFFSDLIDMDTYREMLDATGCCKGFKASTIRNGYATLRVSAKYTEFDIHPYKVIVSPNRVRTRAGRKAAIVQELLRLGQECGTHFASLYPQWAQFREDLSSWKVSGRKGPLRRVKKMTKQEYVMKKAAMAEQKMAKTVKYKMAYGGEQPSGDYIVKSDSNQWFTSSTTTTTADISFSNNAVWTNK